MQNLQRDKKKFFKQKVFVFEELVQMLNIAQYVNLYTL